MRGPVEAPLSKEIKKDGGLCLRTGDNSEKLHAKKNNNNKSK